MPLHFYMQHNRSASFLQNVNRYNSGFYLAMEQGTQIQMVLKKCGHFVVCVMRSYIILKMDVSSTATSYIGYVYCS
jgi:hypothetical protein